MMIDITKPSALINNQRARLTSPVIIPNGEQCVEYWYYTDAEILSSNSRLRVYVRPSTQSTNSTGYLIGTERIFRVRIDFFLFSSDQSKHKDFHFQDRQWRVAQQRIPSGLTSPSYQVIFEGTIVRSGANSPIIALDDIFIRDRACLEPGDCDFENG